MTPETTVLRSLIIASEKAANITRLCRQNGHLFQLLVEKKSASEGNPRFVDDFKTLADVLIQQMIKHDLGRQYPELADSIKGEENNGFCNKLGQKITVEVKGTPHETADLLKTVLNGDEEAARLLAAEVHKDLEFDTVPISRGFQDDITTTIDLRNLIIWIDPIDSTAEYINGGAISGSDLAINGLECVTVLIGGYDRTTGTPILGVVNQPFHRLEEKWEGVCFWGGSLGTSFVKDAPRTRTIVISSSETGDVKRGLQEGGFKVVEVAGAGYKILTVLMGVSDAYLLSKGSTFKWDTCGPQAILRGLGGDIVSYERAMRQEHSPIRYDLAELCNRNGIIAYRSRVVLDELVRCLQ